MTDSKLILRTAGEALVYAKNDYRDSGDLAGLRVALAFAMGVLFASSEIQDPMRKNIAEAYALIGTDEISNLDFTSAQVLELIDNHLA